MSRMPCNTQPKFWNTHWLSSKHTHTHARENYFVRGRLSPKQFRRSFTTGESLRPPWKTGNGNTSCSSYGCTIDPNQPPSRPAKKHSNLQEDILNANFHLFDEDEYELCLSHVRRVERWHQSKAQHQHTRTERELLSKTS